MGSKSLAVVLAALTLVCAGGALVSAAAKPQAQHAHATVLQGASAQVKQSTATDAIGQPRDYVVEPDGETSKSKSGSGEVEATMPTHQRTWTATPYQLSPSSSSSDDGKQKSDGH